MLPIRFSAVPLAVCLAMATTLVRAENEGLEELDQATELQLKAESLQDLSEVVRLSESAIEKGLDEENTKFANQLIVSSLWQHASQLTAGIFEQGRLDRRWPRLRDQAMADLDKLHKRDDKFADAYVLEAKLQALPGGKRDQAIAAINKAVELQREAGEQDKQVESLLLRAALRENLDERLADVNEALQLAPASVAALTQRAAIRIQRNELEQALADFQELLKQDPTNLEVHQAIVEMYVQLEQYNEAVDYATKAIELSPETSRYYVLRSGLYEAQEKFDEALADLTKAIEVEPDSAAALLARARLHFFREDLEAARTDVKRLLQVAPDLPQGMLLKSMLAAADNDFPTAIATLQTILRSDPTNIELRQQLAAYYVADQRPRKAIQVLTQVLNDDKENWRAMRARGDALLSISKHADAIEDYNKALTIQPDDDGVLNNLAWVLATSPDDKLRDGKRSIQLATRACEVTNYERAHILSTLAAAYAETGDFENAIKWSTKACELGEKDLKEQLEQLKNELDHYQQNKPFRELQNIEEKPDPPANLLET